MAMFVTNEMSEAYAKVVQLALQTANWFRGEFVVCKLLKKWRKRVGVEPTDDRIACHPPVLKTGTITGPHALPHCNKQMPRMALPHVRPLPCVRIRAKPWPILLCDQVTAAALRLADTA